MLKPVVDPALADAEQLALGPVDRLLDLGRILVADAGDLAGGRDQVAQDRLALDDPGVLDGMDGGRGLVGEAREVRPSADRLELLAALERLGDRDDVDRLAPLEQVEHRGVDDPVRLAVEVFRAEELGDLDDRVAIDQDRAEDGLLGFEALGRKTVDHGTPRLLEAVTTQVSRPGARKSQSSSVEGRYRSTKTAPGRRPRPPIRREGSQLVDRPVDESRAWAWLRRARGGLSRGGG